MGAFRASKDRGEFIIGEADLYLVRAPAIDTRTAGRAIRGGRDGSALMFLFGHVGTPFPSSVKPQAVSQ
jgi:hypothetical protein